MADVLPMTGVEVIYPIVPLHMVDKVLSQQDSMGWKVLALTADKVRDMLRFRVRQSNFDAFLAFLETHIVPTVIGDPPMELNIPGVYAFGKNYYRSNVRLVSYSGHMREAEKDFRIDVTFEFHTGLA